MIVNEMTDPQTGKKRLHDFRPFTAETPEEEMLLYFLYRVSGSLEDIEAATVGDIDNAVVQQLYQTEQVFSGKLDRIIELLSLIAGKGVK